MESSGQESYHIHFIQHAPEPAIDVAMRPVNIELRRHMEKAGHALKTGGGKRIVLALKKEAMIQIYNCQANYGIQTECIAALRARGLESNKQSNKQLLDQLPPKMKRNRKNGCRSATGTGGQHCYPCWIKWYNKLNCYHGAIISCLGCCLTAITSSL